MCNITTCSIKNNVDQKNMTLCVEWNIDNIKILIMRHEELPCKGEMTIAELVKYADNFNRSKDEYFTDMKVELSGENREIQFSLKDNVFIWKKKVWTRGKIPCIPLTKTIDLSNFLINFINENSLRHTRTVELTSENRKFRKKVERMEKAIERMTIIKNTIEQELCRRFLILLNSKKSQIRALRDQLNEYTKDPIFDKLTDESDVELTETNLQSVKRAKININTNACETSTSGLSIFNKIAHAVDNTHDSDESIELKLEESQTYEKKSLNITDEDPEEDIFSSQKF